MLGILRKTRGVELLTMIFLMLLVLWVRILENIIGLLSFSWEKITKLFDLLDLGSTKSLYLKYERGELFSAEQEFEDILVPVISIIDEYGMKGIEEKVKSEVIFKLKHESNRAFFLQYLKENGRAH